MSNAIHVYCASCDGNKNQKKLFSKSRIDPLTKIKEEYSVIQCLGCGALAFLQSQTSKRTSRPIHHVFPYDADESYYLFLDYEYKELMPKQIQQLYDEIECAFDSDSAILAGIGLRAMVEAICLDQRIPGHNLQIKLDGLLSKGLIAVAERPILDKLRLIGNASAHEIKSLPMNKLELALSIVNHVLKSMYILPIINKQLRLTTKKKSSK